MPRLQLVLLIHAHQPVGNFDDVLEQCYARSYLPFLECLGRHPSVRLGLHYSGPLLEWIEPRHPEFFDRLRELVARGQVELVGGGFYEPILVAIPAEDRLIQIRGLADYLEQHFGRRPSGAWLAERVWEPQLPGSLAAAGVEYTLVDDIHFLASGFELSQLHGYYIVEDLGATVKVFPGLKELRYLIPFRSVEDNVEMLRRVAREHPGRMAAMGDDNEKFGAWPGTWEHCYRNGWLDRFFAALEANSDWLAATPPGEYVATNPPLGRAELPTGSYSEMMEWALPTSVRHRFKAALQEFSSRPEIQIFLRGGFWRNFLTKYAETNLLHKKMLYVSGKVRRLAGRRRGLSIRRKLEEATTHLLRAQCNDAYWHGIFGGLYAPHLRTALWRELIRAEKIADGVTHGRTSYAEVERLDFDADGAEEIYLTSPQFAALLKPADGGTLAALDFRKRDVTLINSLQRRPEAYHARLREVAAAGAGQVASIHEQTRVKEQGLERRLRYDRWPRHAFRLLLFDAAKTYEDYEALGLGENPALAAGAYDIVTASAEKVEMVGEAPLDSPAAGEATPSMRACKTFAFGKSGNGFWVACDLVLSHSGPEPLKLQVGLETVLNFLAPGEPDRYFDTGGQRHPLSWAAATPASSLRVVDGWQKVAATIEAPAASQFWVAPIETVSESEGGFERVYQGSQILAVWPAELEPHAAWTARLVLHVAPVR